MSKHIGFWLEGVDTLDATLLRSRNTVKSKK